jgi:hypothetical protein
MTRKTLLSFALLAACSPHNSFFGDGSDGGGTDSGLFFAFDSGDASGPCVNLQCNVQSCGGGHTTVSGTVYDPAGRNPLYNVYVYVPNAPVDPIPTGAICAQCQAPASGSPLAGAVQSDALGHFTVMDVPVGANIPLVMQVGKFRRQIIIPQVNACTDNPIGQKDSNGLEMQTRLPRTQNEGNNNVDNLPQMAMATGGCDQLECLMRKIGIADSEFSSTGRVHLFQGMGGSSGPGSMDAYAFWANETALVQHDIVLNSCECAPYDRDTEGTAYQSMHDYLSAGGRMFGTHYHYNWFAPPTGPSDFQTTASWGAANGIGPPFYINTTIPKGVALNAWIQNVWSSAAPPNGQINLDYSAEDVAQVNAAEATPWIYYGSPSLSGQYSTAYLSFNTPVGSPITAQCGRAVFSDLHVSTSGGAGGTFPLECFGDPLTTPMTEQESALEFLFFDLSSCVGDDSEPPPPPPH